MKQKVLALLLTSAMLVGLTGCAAITTEAPATAPAPAAEAEAEDSGDEAQAGGGVVYGIYKAGDQTWFIDE